MEKESHNLTGVLEQMDTPANEPPEVTAKVQRLMVYTNFSLHGTASKVETIQANPLCAGKWVVFVNRAGTLAHVMHADEAEDGSHSRFPLRHKLKGAHENYIRRYFYNRMIARYII